MATPATPVNGLPRALTIAGSDSGGGAGIQADLKVFFALGCHGLSAQTALTAQNTVGVTGIFEVPGEFVIQQVDAVATDIGVDAAKTGMLASSSIVEAVAKAVEAHDIRNLVVDPVSVSKHRDQLLADEAVDSLKARLFPLAALVTPNLYETSLLVDRDVKTLDEMKTAAEELHALGPSAVLVKGGHLARNDAVDVFFDGRSMVEIAGPRYDTQDTHGTGCALSAAVTARLAQGDVLVEGVRFAKHYVAGAIKNSLRLGRGYGPVNPGWFLEGAAGGPASANHNDRKPPPLH